jgi:hypothetical protein
MGARASRDRLDRETGGYDNCDAGACRSGKAILSVVARRLSSRVTTHVHWVVLRPQL